MVLLRTTTLALACGYAVGIRLLTPSGPSSTGNPGAACCITLAEMNAAKDPSSPYVYEACRCAFQYQIEAGVEPPFNQKTGNPAVGVNSLGFWGCTDVATPYMHSATHPLYMKAREWCDKPQGACPYGFYENGAITYGSCQSQSGDKIIGFAKESLAAGDPWSTYPSVLVMMKGLQEFDVLMKCWEDFDMLIGYDGYTGPAGQDCVVGRDCTYDRDSTLDRISNCGGTYNGPAASQGPFCIDENNLQSINPTPSSSTTWYFSGATEGQPVCEERFAASSIAIRDYTMRIMPTQSAYAQLIYSFSGISPCPQMPPDHSCTRDTNKVLADDPNAVAEATGDPHMRNLNGEVFDLSQEGEHVLIQIPEGTGERLEVVGTVAAFHKKRKCPLFFLTQLKVQGTLVGEVPLEIIATESRFGVKQGTEFMNLNSEEGVVVGQSSVQTCDDDNNICRMTSPARRTAKYPDRVLLQMPSVAIVASNYPSANPSFLNLAVSGLPSEKSVGGLLGYGDHSHVTADDEACKKSKSTRKVSMLQQPSFSANAESSIVGHVW